jgi:hypothetical protein
MYLLFMKFDEQFSQNVVRRREFRENRIRKSHTLLKRVREFISVVSVLLSRFEPNSVWKYIYEIP